MIESIKNNIIAENHKLKARVNTLELENELLKDKRLDELLKELNKESKCEELEKQLERANSKIQTLKEIIKDGCYAKNKK